MDDTTRQDIYTPGEDVTEDREVLSALGFAGEFGVFGDSLICEHGYEIEMDGECPEGCTGIL